MQAKKPRRWRGRFAAVAVAQISLFIVLCFGFFIFTRTAPRHAARTQPPAHSSAAALTEFLEEEDRVLFAASTVSLTLVTFILAIFAIFTWIGIKETVEDKVASALEGYHRVERARIDSQMGTIYGQFLRLIDPKNEAKRGYFLEIAILHLQRAHSLLDGEDATRAKNNLAFYLASRKQDADAEEAVKLAEECLKSRNPEKEVDILTTYGFVVANFAEFLPEGEYLALQAQRQMQKLRQRKNLTENNKAEVERNLGLLQEALAVSRKKRAAGELPDESPGKLLRKAAATLWKRWISRR